MDSVFLSQLYFSWFRIETIDSLFCHNTMEEIVEAIVSYPFICNDGFMNFVWVNYRNSIVKCLYYQKEVGSLNNYEIPPKNFKTFVWLTNNAKSRNNLLMRIRENHNKWNECIFSWPIKHRFCFLGGCLVINQNHMVLLKFLTNLEGSFRNLPNLFWSYIISIKLMETWEDRLYRRGFQML